MLSAAVLRVFDFGYVFACVRGLQITHRLALLCEEKSGQFCFASQSCATLLFMVRVGVAIARGASCVADLWAL